MLNRKSELNLTCKTLLYKIALRPIMTYAAPLLSQASSTNRKRLQVAQNKLLRMIQDVPRYTSTQQIHKNSNIEKIDELLEKLTTNFTNKYEMFVSES